MTQQNLSVGAVTRHQCGSNGVLLLINSGIIDPSK